MENEETTTTPIVVVEQPSKIKTYVGIALASVAGLLGGAFLMSRLGRDDNDEDDSTDYYTEAYGDIEEN